MTTVVAPPPGPSSSPRQGRWHPPAWVWLVLAVALLLGGQAAKERLDRALALRPLHAAALASEIAKKPIATVSPATNRRWDQTDYGSPTEPEIKKMVRPGNVFLEPAWYALASSDMSAMSNSDRCYYFAVQRGQAFDVDRVSALTRLCYIDGDEEVYGGGTITIPQRGAVPPGPEWHKITQR